MSVKSGNTLCYKNNEKQGNSPIMEFKAQIQADECLSEWQRRLFLDDWIIKVKLMPSHEIDTSGNLCGYCDAEYSIKTAVIQIANDIIPDSVSKVCAEKTLVHELLHCKHINLEPNSNNYSGQYMSICQHQLIEEMSKSLIMAKYGVQLDWFKNF
jgi:hypothetical protein